MRVKQQGSPSMEQLWTPPLPQWRSCGPLPGLNGEVMDHSLAAILLSLPHQWHSLPFIMVYIKSIYKKWSLNIQQLDNQCPIFSRIKGRYMGLYSSTCSVAGYLQPTPHGPFRVNNYEALWMHYGALEVYYSPISLLRCICIISNMQI